jgi:hypothetical protein
LTLLAEDGDTLNHVQGRIKPQRSLVVAKIPVRRWALAAADFN